MSDRFMIRLINARNQSNYMTKLEQKKSQTLEVIDHYRSIVESILQESFVGGFYKKIQGHNAFS